jgi:23S rRNA (guanosine2251-2'-O)-methyltransferase
MAQDDTRGRRGFDSRGGRDDRPYSGFQKRDRDARGGQPGHDSGQRERTPWRSDDAGRGAGGSDTRPGRSFRPPFAREASDESATPFQGDNDRSEKRPDDERPPFRSAPGNDRPPFRGGSDDRPPFRSSGDRPPFRGAGDRPPFRGGSSDRPPFRGGSSDRPPFRGGSSDRPPFRGAPGGDRPSFRSDRPAFSESRGENDRPWQKEHRDEGRPSFADRGQASGREERPTYRQGRGGYRSFDQDLPRGEHPAPAYRGERPFQRDDSASGSRRPYGGDRPPFQDRRPSYGNDRSSERREPGAPSFENAGRPLGTITRAGHSPVSQYERIQADVYGRWPVLESLRAGNVVKVYFAAGVKDSADHLQEIQAIAAEKHITIVRVDRFDLDRALGNVNHQGIAAACRPFQYADFADIITAAAKTGEQPLVLLFDGVQDPQNLGSILRSGEAVGIDGAVLPKHNQAGITPAVVRASAGAVEHVAIAEVTNLRQSIASLKEAGYWIVGLDMDGGTDYDNFDVNGPLALVVGGEGHGLSRMISEECDYLVKLPMRGKVSSLNASVAAGIVLYEIGRRRGTAGTPKASSKSGVVEAEIEDVLVDETDLETDIENILIDEVALEAEIEVDLVDEAEAEDIAFEEIFEDESEEDEIDAAGDGPIVDSLEEDEPAAAEHAATDVAEETEQTLEEKKP